MRIPKQTTTFNVKDLISDLSKSDREDAKEFIAEELIDLIKDRTSKGKSPINDNRFPVLSKEYANAMKGGDRKPDLRLFGELMESLDYKIKGNVIELGVFDKSQKGKADGHNNLSGLSPLPERRFIPGEDETFSSYITKEIKKEVVKEFGQASKNKFEREARTKATIKVDSKKVEDIVLKRIFQDIDLESLGISLEDIIGK